MALKTILSFNPMSHFVGAMRHAVYLLEPPTLVNWTAMVVAAGTAVGLGWWVFATKAPRFIEEI